MPWHKFRSTPRNVFQHVQIMSGYSMRSNSQLFSKMKLSAEDIEKLSWAFEFEAAKSTIYHPEINYDRNETFHYRCSCNDNSKICLHIRAAFDWLAEKRGNSYFESLKNWDEEKSAMLEEYGLKLDDKEAGEIEFNIDYFGRLQMKVPAWLWGKNAENKISNFKKSLVPHKEAQLFSERPKLTKDAIIDFQVGFLFNFTSMHFKTSFELETIKVFEKGNVKSYKKLSIHNVSNLPLLKELPDEVYNLLLSFTDDGVKGYLKKNGHGYLANYSNPWLNTSDDSIALIEKHYAVQLKKIWLHLCEHGNVYLLKEGNFSNKNVQPAQLSADLVSLGFSIEEDERFITIRRLLIKNKNVVNAKDVRFYTPGIFIIDEELHLPENLEDLDIFNRFEHGYIKIPVANRLSVITNIIPSLQQKYSVQLPPSLQLNTIKITPKPQVLLKEYTTQYLMLKPQFVYEALTVDYEANPQDILQTLPDGSQQLILRDVSKEKAFFEDLKNLHSSFQRQVQNDFYYLPFDDVMKKNWFINTVRQLQDNEIPVLGMQELKKFRYNTNKPVWDMKAGSGTDWFDLKIKISYGDQSISLKDVRKALVNKQNIVLLGDGTIGVLPEEWLQQYGLLLKMGDEQKDGTLRLSKLHYTLIDELHDQIDDEQVIEEINNKKQKLLNIENVKTVQISNAINASLRPYQQSSFQWMQTLDELGWGGCLADDMGLGKTLQAITFLQFVKEKYTGSTNLVICPTSLIYNWESELKKFAPSLGYHIYYGSSREFSNEHFEDYDIIITSYGIKIGRAHV